MASCCGSLARRPATMLGRLAGTATARRRIQPVVSTMRLQWPVGGHPTPLAQMRHFCSAPAVVGPPSGQPKQQEQDQEQKQEPSSVPVHVVDEADAVEVLDQGMLKLPGTRLQTEVFVIMYTCKVCGNRSARQVSKNAYNGGVVIIKCPGCKSLHLFADRLDWFGKGNIDIDGIMKAKGASVHHVQGLQDLSSSDIQVLKREAASVAKPAAAPSTDKTGAA